MIFNRFITSIMYIIITYLYVIFVRFGPSFNILVRSSLMANCSTILSLVRYVRCTYVRTYIHTSYIVVLLEKKAKVAPRNKLAVFEFALDVTKNNRYRYISNRTCVYSYQTARLIISYIICNRAKGKRKKKKDHFPEFSFFQRRVSPPQL